MKITYDKSADAAYISFIENPNSGWVKSTYPCDQNQINGMINLDFDQDGKLGGIEILDASKKLPVELLKLAEQL
jgi:uncharacterized protein YuzE